MGATVDYAILLATKFKRNMATMPVKQACLKATKDSTLSILTSASILGALCLAVCAITTNAIIGQVTLLIGRGAIISGILILFVLPALLIAITRKPPTNNDIFHKIRLKIDGKLQNKRNKKQLAMANVCENCLQLQEQESNSINIDSFVESDNSANAEKLEIDNVFSNVEENIDKD